MPEVQTSSENGRTTHCQLTISKILDAKNQAANAKKSEIPARAAAIGFRIRLPERPLTMID